jgi:hypothetical protein
VKTSDLALFVPIVTALIAGYSAVKAARAERNSRPVSNGFASGVKTSLRGLESHLDDVHKDVRELRQAILDHLANHP